MKKDWTGNSTAYAKTLGATSHSTTERQQHDYYATEPKAVNFLLQLEDFKGSIWECACGEGHLSEEIKKHGFDVYSTDLIDRGYGNGVFDFLSIENTISIDHNIITNPPYRYANDFILKALSIMKTGKKLALFLPIRYLEGKARKHIFLEHPPKTVYVSSSRLLCAKNGEFEQMIAGGGSAVAYAWFVWEKGFNGQTELQWFN